MKRLFAGSFVVLVIACGGTLEGQNKKGDPKPCADQGTCSNGDKCTMPVPQCPGETPSTFLCECVNGSFACPDIGRPGCNEPPPKPPGYELCGIAGKATEGDWCPPEAKGESCEAFKQPTCSEPLPKVMCTCNGAQFVCGKQPACPDPIDAGSPD